jgi:hypothetical protein
MKSMKSIIMITSALLLPSLVQAEDDAAAAEKPHPFGINAEFGTTGLGGTVSWRFLPHLGVRGGMHYLRWTSPDFEFEGDASTTTFNARLLLQSEPVTLDIYPWKNRSFRISAGVLFNQNEFTGTSVGDVEINGITYPGEQLNVEITQDDVCPYISIGGAFCYFDRAKRWSLGGEIGVAYTGSPNVFLTNPTGGIPPGELASERQDIEDDAEDFKFWPVLKLYVSFQF